MIKLTFDWPSLLLLSLSLAACSIASDFDRSFPECKPNEPCPAACHAFCEAVIHCGQTNPACEAGKFLGPTGAAHWIDECTKTCKLEAKVTLDDLAYVSTRTGCVALVSSAGWAEGFCAGADKICSNVCRLEGAAVYERRPDCGFGSDCHSKCMDKPASFWKCVDYDPGNAGTGPYTLCDDLYDCQ